MAGRPLALTIRDNSDGTASIRVPVVGGVSRRVSVNFPSREVAERYRAAALATWEAKRQIPDPAPYQSVGFRSKDQKNDGTFPSVAWNWFERNYPANNTNPERRNAVRSIVEDHLIPFFAPRVDHTSELTSLDVEDFVRFMAGERPTVSQNKDDLAREYTLTGAAALTGRNRSTLQRAWQNGAFPNAHKVKRGREKGIVKIPLADLVNSRYAPAHQQKPYAYSYGSVKEMLSVLRNIFEHAMARGIVSVNPARDAKPRKPAMYARTLRKHTKDDEEHIDLVTSQQIASHLQIHHVMVFWLLRAAGLRISEAFGITLDSISYIDEQMYIAIRAQGGRSFRVHDADFNEVRVDRKESVKTRTSKRVIPVARQLQELIELYIEIFHEDSDPRSPLVHNTSMAAQGAFRAQLRRAQVASGNGFADRGFEATPHSLRDYLSTDLDEINQRIRSVYMGHQLKGVGGSDTTESVYTLRKKDPKRLQEASGEMEKLITEKIGTLVVPVPAQILAPRELFSDYATHQRVVDALEAAGFIGETVVDGEEVLRISEAAALLSISEIRVKRLLGQGILESRPIRGPGMKMFGGVSRASVMRRLEADQVLWTRKRICEEFDLSYLELVRLIEKLDLKAASTEKVKGLRYHDDEVERLRAHFATKERARRNAVSVSGVCRELAISKSAVEVLLATTQLVLDKRATETLGMRMVTRKSLDDLIRVRVERPTPPVSRPPGSIPIREAQERTGRTRTEVLQLRSQGVVIYRSSDYQFHVDEASLQRFFD